MSGAPRIVHIDDVRAQPWKNGGGLTRELLAWPSRDAWSVRVSVADIERDGPFSPFPGVERWFTVLEGAGVVLDFAGPGTELLVLALLAVAVGPDTLLPPTEDIGVLAAQSLAIAIAVSVAINLVPHPVPRPPGQPGPSMIVNDGLGILRSFWMPDAYFAEMLDAEALDVPDDDTDEPM